MPYNFIKIYILLRLAEIKAHFLSQTFWLQSNRKQPRAYPIIAPSPPQILTPLLFKLLFSISYRLLYFCDSQAIEFHSSGVIKYKNTSSQPPFLYTI